MSTIPRCEAKDPASCTDERCPQRLYHAAALNNAVKSRDFEAFVAAKEVTKKPSFSKVKLPADFRKVVKAMYPDVMLQLSGDGSNGDFVTLNLIKVPEELRGMGVATNIMSELAAAADKHGWNLALSPSDDWKSSKLRLEVFYRRFGFRPNKGRTRDFGTRETMVRYPLG